MQDHITWTNYAQCGSMSILRDAAREVKRGRGATHFVARAANLCYTVFVGATTASLCPGGGNR